MFSTYSGTEPRYSSGSWFPLTRLQLDGYPLVAGATSAELLPTLDLLAVGAWPSDVYFFNISSVHRSPPPYLQPFSILKSRGWVVLEIAEKQTEGNRVERERGGGQMERWSFCPGFIERVSVGWGKRRPVGDRPPIPWRHGV